MGGIYGSFLDRDHDNYSTYYQKFEDRCRTHVKIAATTVAFLEKQAPEIEGLLAVSSSNVMLANVRYYNEVVRLKAMHDIETIRWSKVFSYTAHWLHRNPAIVSVASLDQYFQLDKANRLTLLNANYVCIGNIGSFFLRGFNIEPPHSKWSSVTTEMRDTMETGQYQPNNFAFLLDQTIS